MNRIFLVRHSVSAGNLDNSLYFTEKECDIELAPGGEKQAEDAADKITGLLRDVYEENNKRIGIKLEWSDFYFNMFYSPYVRAKQSADIIKGKIESTKGYKIESYNQNPILVERKWGQLRDIVTNGEKTEDHFNFFYTPENGESFADVYNRTELFHQHLLSRETYDNVIIVAHGEFNKVYLMRLLGWDIDEFDKWRTPRNGEVYMLNRSGRDSWMLSPFTPLTERTIKH